MATIKNHLDWDIVFDKYISNPAQVPRSAKIVNCYYDQNYDSFTVYRTPSGRTYARHDNRSIAKQYQESLK
jgi:hypothetical protein